MRNEISDRLVDFAAAVIGLVEKFPAKTTVKKLTDQLLRSATSVGANYEEAQGAESKADFVHKFQIALKEIRESYYWLRVVEKSMPSLGLHTLIDEARKIRAILSKSIATAKGTAK